MTIRIKSTGEVIDHASWFGFNFWARAWVTGPNGAGWLHLARPEFEVVTPDRI